MAKLNRPAAAAAAGISAQFQSNQSSTKSPGAKFNKNKKKSFGNEKFKKRGSGPEALDLDMLDGDGDETGVDASEISAFVKKLGLNNFNMDGLSTSKVTSKKDSSKGSKIKVKNSKTPASDSQEATETILEADEGVKKAKKGKTLKNGETKNKKKIMEFDDAEVPALNVESKPKNKGKALKQKKKDGQDSKVSDQGMTRGRGGPTPKKVKLVVKSDGKWYEDEQEEPQEELKPNKFVRKDEIAKFKKSAEDLLLADVTAYKASNMAVGKKSDFQWMEKMMKNGTLPDKMAAYIVRIQDSPIHNLNYLQNLIGMVKIQGKQQCLITADTVKELFLEDLLPPNRKLLTFESRAAHLPSATKKQLVTWIFEDKLKAFYLSFVEALKKMAGDTVEKLRGKALSIVHQLLAAHPELEEVLLQVLVNKLGDPAKKMGSRALFYLQQLLDEHPRMKKVVVDEVERLLFRNNISKRAQYYGICFLNVIKLDGEHASLGHKLITVYLAFFKASVKTGDIDTKMMSGLLTGINRAFPSAQEFGFQFTESLDTLYMIVRLSQFAIGVQALSILFQIINVSTNPAGADRFYRVLYEKLLAPEFLTTSHNIQFLNLVFRAMKADIDVNRIISFIKRLLQICQTVPPNLACAILILISEVAKNHPSALRIGEMSQPEKDEKTTAETVNVSDSEDEETVNSTQQKDENLQKLMKSTNISLVDPDRDKELEPVVIECNRKKKNKQAIEESSQSSKLLVPSYFPEDTQEQLEKEKQNDVPSSDPIKGEDEEDIKPDIKRIILNYSPHARNPSFAGAELVLAYELMALAHHFHPSVALFAQTLISKKSIKYDGNPLKDFTLSRFLERFVYRNAKVNKSNRPEYRPQGLRNIPVNSEGYLKASEESIPPEERFFYKYFTQRKDESVKVKKEDDIDELSDTESVGDDEFEDLMKNYFKTAKGSNPDSDEDDVKFDEDSESVDFAAGISTSGAGKKKGKKREAEEESDDDDEDDDEDINDNDSLGDDFIDLDGDDDEDDEDDLDDDDLMEDGDFDDDDDIMGPPKTKKLKKSLKGEDMFAPADEFAEMLEENAEESLGGSHTLINKERADAKQLKWEADRDRWVKGFPTKKKFTGNKKKFGRRK